MKLRSLHLCCHLKPTEGGLLRWKMWRGIIKARNVAYPKLGGSEVLAQKYIKERRIAS